MHVQQTKQLRNAAFTFSQASGHVLSAEVEGKSNLLVWWLQYLTTYALTHTADHLLLAASSAIRETAASLSLGLVRPALYSLRCEIDLVLGWLFYKDHQVEWDHINDTGENFKLRKELLQYLDTHHKGFKARLSLLAGIATRSEEDPYKLLSAHIHGQSAAALPNMANLKDIVRPLPECIACASAAFEVAEYLNDVLMAVYASNWHSLPAAIQSALTPRFVSTEQRSEFFA